MGGSQSTNSTQTNSPPAWAQPGLEAAGNQALNLYNQGVGFQTYTGQRQAPLSAATLGGINGLLAATGSKAPPVSNSSLQAILSAAKASMPAVHNTPIPQAPPPQPQTLSRVMYRRDGTAVAVPGLFDQNGRLNQNSPYYSDYMHGFLMDSNPN